MYAEEQARLQQQQVANSHYIAAQQNIAQQNAAVMAQRFNQENQIAAERRANRVGISALHSRRLF